MVYPTRLDESLKATPVELNLSLKTKFEGDRKKKAPKKAPTIALKM
jgi:hypothetical protein